MDMRLAIGEVLKRADADAATSVIVLRANGRSFCVGFDVGGGHEQPWRHDALKYHQRLTTSFQALMTPWTLRKPVIASVQGHALGGGCELAMFCDLTIAAENAVFGEPEMLFSHLGPALVMPMIIGHKRARELPYFGDTIDAQTALSYGMVNRVVPLAELRATTMKYAKRMALIAPEAPAAAKLAVNRGGYDLYARTVARHWARHIPGNPAFVPQNMPGAGTRIAANWLYNAAPKDGTAVGTVVQSTAVDQALGEPGIRFDAAQFNWLGNPIVDNLVTLSWSASGLATL